MSKQATWQKVGRVAGPALIGAAVVFAACTQARGGRDLNRPLRTLTGQEALGDWTTDAPGVRRKITVADLPKPYATPSVDNGPKMVPQPEGAMPKVPEGFQVTELAGGMNNPRNVITAPNGDFFIAESQPGRIRMLRDADNDGKAELNTIFAEGHELPFGLAFYPHKNPKYLYVANTGAIVRYRYSAGDTKASGSPEVVVADIPSGGRLRGGGHWTRDVQFCRLGKKMYVSVGSKTNVSDGPQEDRRAAVLEYTPEGKSYRLYASGIRNPVTIRMHPETGEIWTSVNERDEIGDHLVPDYISSVKEGGFYGWPWYYIGGNQDPRHEGKHPELKNKVIVPDVLLQSHSASLGMTFYTGKSFPDEYRNHAFAAEHGSWNRARRTGYKVIRVPINRGKATGEYEDFMTGFVTPEGNVWGRPVGVTVARDGALIVTDDGGNRAWRVSYKRR